MKPSAAKVHFLVARLHRIREQGSHGCDTALERTHSVPGTVVIGHLLIKISANANGKTKGKVLVQRPFEVELSTALIVCLGI
jgi:hypothetical protein